MKRIAFLAAAALAAISAAPVSAAINYSFTGYGPGGTVSTTFSFTTATFLTGPNTEIAASALDSCSSVFGACGSQIFYREAPFGDNPGGDVLASQAGELGVFYPFQFGAFATLGEHISHNPDLNVDNRLTVSEVTPVPEPGEWAMMAAGLGVAGFAARRRRKA